MTTKNYDFTTGEKLLDLCASERLPISEIMIRREIARADVSYEVIFEEMRSNLEVMRASIELGTTEKQSSVTGFTGGDAIKLKRYRSKSYMGDFMCDLAASALSVVEVNSSMGKIVAAPTAGSSGVLPACLIKAAEKFNLDDNAIIKGLFTASAVGMIIAEQATLAGAEGGCQAEVGSASAMAAAALCDMRGAAPATSLSAAGIALKMILGLVCDPVAGLVECPCIKRNAMGAVNAYLAADMALAGVASLIPFDEVIMAVRSVGRQMNVDLRETAKGGLAATPTGKELMRMLKGTEESD